MTIRPDKDIHGTCLFFYMFIPLFVFMFNELGVPVVGVSMSLFWFVFTTRLWIAEGRTYVMDEFGCTIIFWRIRRFYKWDEFKQKAYVDPSKITTANYFHGWAEFSLSDKKRPSHIDPSNYLDMVLNPFTYVYVSFNRPPLKKTSHNNEYRGFFSYYCDESVFKEKMTEWGVM